MLEPISFLAVAYCERLIEKQLIKDGVTLPINVDVMGLHLLLGKSGCSDCLVISIVFIMRNLDATTELFSMLSS